MNFKEWIAKVKPELAEDSQLYNLAKNAHVAGWLAGKKDCRDAELRDMLVQTHTTLGITRYLQLNRRRTWADWEALSDKSKDEYCKSASISAGIDHEKYLKVLEESK